MNIFGKRTRTPAGLITLLSFAAFIGTAGAQSVWYDLSAKCSDGAVSCNGCTAGSPQCPLATPTCNLTNSASGKMCQSDTRNCYGNNPKTYTTCTGTCAFDNMTPCTVKVVVCAGTS